MKQTRYGQVAERILNLINNGVLKEGEKIPSIRQLSQELNVSINTVKEAYWKLERQNYIVAVPQSGFYVRKRSSDIPTREEIDPCRLDPQKVSLCHIYGAFQNMGQCTPEVSLGIATLNPEFWPTQKMGRYFQEAIRYQEKESYNYIMSPGYLQLREQIARSGLSCGLDLSPDEIIITNGCHESVFLALMVLCKPGDSVVFESPMYFNLLQLLEQLDLKIIELPSSQIEGVHLDTLEFVIENYPVKAMFSISNVNNPLGFSMPTWKKKKLVELLTENEIPLIEDDIYGDLCFETRDKTCKSFDAEGNVILCSSFSKTLAPGLRVGWIVPGKHYDRVIKMKTLLNISTASINQIVVARYLKEGGYERHLRKLRKDLKKQIVALRACILEYFPKGTKVTNPSGGFLLWVELPESIDTDIIYQEAVKENILFAPGSLFTMKDKYSNCMRLNAGIWNEQVERAVKHIGQLCANYQKKTEKKIVKIAS
jgi:DNA-binding transcriptional MocR family regulator